MPHKAAFRDLSGLLLLDKPLGLSSSQALSRVRYLLRAQKAGHTGALDPLASGVLPICLGEATKFSGFFLEGDKRYEAEGTLGITTDSADAEGTVLSRCDPGDAWQHLPEIISRFQGPITQVPPAFSAIKVDGRPLYRYAREGREVAIPAREVVIHELKLLAAAPDRFRVSVHCSKGTYIRTLIADIGQALGCGAYVTMLRRTEVSGLPTTPLHTIEEIAALTSGSPDGADHLLLPIPQILTALPRLDIGAADADALCHGRRIACTAEIAPDIAHQIWWDEHFLGVGVVSAGILIPRRMMSNPLPRP